MQASTWYQSLGLYLWYLHLDTTPHEQQSGEADDQLFQSLQAFYTRKPSKPVPWYIEDRAFINELPQGQNTQARHQGRPVFLVFMLD